MSTPESPNSLLAVTVEVFGETITPATLALAVKLARDACACAKCSPPAGVSTVKAPPNICYGLVPGNPAKALCMRRAGHEGAHAATSVADHDELRVVPVHEDRLQLAAGREALGSAHSCLAPEILEALLDRL
jgi:hypothetical protein